MADTDFSLYGLLGNLFGGSQNASLQPIVGQQGIDAAGRSGLLSLGAGLLAAGGPHPYRHSVGQDIAAGIEAGQQGYNSSLDNGLKSALTAQQLRMQMLGYQRQMALMQALMNRFGGGGAGGPASAPLITPPVGGVPPQGSAMGGAATAPPGGAPAGVTSTVGAGAPGGAGGLPQPPAPAAAAAASAATSKFSPDDASKFSPDDASLFSALDPEHAQAYKNIYDIQNPELLTLPDGTVVNPRDTGLLGTNHAALPPGMVRGAGGAVSLAPGFAGAQYALDANKVLAEHSQDLVNVVVPGKGTMTVPRSALGMGLGVGPNGQPQLTLGGSGGFMSQEDPASLAERTADVNAFEAAKKDAMTKSQAATDSLAQLNNLDQLIHTVKPQYGSSAAYEVGRVLDSAGLLKGPESQWVANAKAYQQAQRTQVLSSLKSLFPGRVSNMEVNAASAAMGNIDDPMQAVLYANDVKRVQQRRLQDISGFLQNYNGPRGKYEQAWENSSEGKKSLYDYPEMWKHLPILRGKQGTPAFGKTFVKTPTGTIYPVQLNSFGEPEPLGGE